MKLNYRSFRLLLSSACKLICLLLIIGHIIPLQASNGKIRAHDPVMIKQDSVFYLFTTGVGINVWSGTDMQTWTREEAVFSNPPEWAVSTIPGFSGHIWAPDIFYLDGKYYLFYSVSRFGRNTSSIGLAVNKSLHPHDPGFGWEDRGKVIQSVPGRDLWNAIDPNVIKDDEGGVWMVFGSFWSGIKLFRLNDSLDAPACPQEWYTVAARPREFGTPDYQAGDAAIEAPFIFRSGDYYYLFVSYDHCCRGLNSTYKIMVGRSEEIIGPYLDREGRDMAFGGASLVLEGNDKWPGVGHNSAYTFDGKDYLIFHGYDASDEGRSKLLIRKIIWDNEGWPTVEL